MRDDLHKSCWRTPGACDVTSAVGLNSMASWCFFYLYLYVKPDEILPWLARFLYFFLKFFNCIFFNRMELFEGTCIVACADLQTFIAYLRSNPLDDREGEKGRYF